MKKDRNCGNYPVYPNYNGMMNMPINGVEMPMPMPMGMPTYTYANTGMNNSELTSLNNRLNSLEQRVNNLENMYSTNYSSNNYNTSNYQMM